MTESERIDFKKIISEIESEGGITPYKLSVMMHRRYEQIKRWKNGKEPKHYEGEMLLLIHSHFVTKAGQNPTGEAGDHKSQESASPNPVGLDKRVASVG